MGVHGRAMDGHALRRRLISLAAERHSADGDRPAIDWSLARLQYENEMAKAATVEVSMRTEHYAGVRTEVIDPSTPGRRRVVLFLHGGGYTMGSSATHRALASRVGEAADAVVVLPEYRLAPEHPFPAGLTDARAVWDHLVHNEGVPASSIALIGDSAGGGMAAALTLMLLRAGESLPGTLVLLSPWTDLTLSSPAIGVSYEVDPLVDEEFLKGARDAYVRGQQLTDPLVSPAHGNWRGGPPTLIQVSRSERLLDDARILFDRLVSDGVEVRLEEWDHLVHVWHQFAPALPQATDAIERIGRCVRRYAVEMRTASCPA